MSIALQVVREAMAALTQPYAPCAAATTPSGYAHNLDRHLVPLIRAARLRGCMAVAGTGIADHSAHGELLGSDHLLKVLQQEDDAVLLIERAREADAPALRAECLARALDRLAALPDVLLPPLGPGQEVVLRTARARTQLWADAAQV